MKFQQICSLPLIEIVPLRSGFIFINIDGCFLAAIKYILFVSENILVLYKLFIIID